MTCFPSFCDSLSFSLFVRRMPSRYFWPKLQVQMQLPQWWSLWLQDWGLLLPPWLHRSWLQLKWVRKTRSCLVFFFNIFFEVTVSGLLVISSSLFFLENCEQPQLRQPMRPMKERHSSSSFCICIYTFVWMKTCLFLQVVWADTTGRTVLSCAPVERGASATQQLGSVTVPLAGWVSPANKVKRCLRLWARAAER